MRYFDYICEDCGEMFEVTRSSFTDQPGEELEPCAKCLSTNTTMYWGHMNFFMGGNFDTPRRKD